MKCSVRKGIIAVDFDGTCVTNDFPFVGRNVGAELVLKALQDNGSRIVLWSCRGSSKKSFDGSPLTTDILKDATDWFEKNGIILSGVNCLPSDINTWTVSPKIYYDLLIDDHSLGCPLIGKQYKTSKGLKTSVFVDWLGVSIILHRAYYLSDSQFKELAEKLKFYYERF